jgi:Mrp family chromosome partitioning ATPase
VTPREIWRDIVRAWPAALLSFLVVLGLLVAYAVVPAPHYTSTATVAVQPKNTAGAAAGNFSSTGLQVLAPVIKARAESDAVKRAVRSDVPGADTAPFTVSADLTPDSPLVTVTVSTTSRSLAVPIARAYVTELTSYPTVGSLPVAVVAVQPPVSVSTPSRAVRAVTGAVEGLVLGIVVAAIVALLLGAFRRRRDLQRRVPAELGTPVLASVPSRSRGDAARADDLRELAAWLKPQADSGALGSVAFLSRRPGVGRTTIAVQTARALAGTGTRVLLVDADLHDPSLPTVLSGAPGAALRRSEEDAPVLTATLPLRRTSESDLSLLTADDLREHARKLGADADRPWAAVVGSIEDVLLRAREAGLFVVVDVPGAVGAVEAHAVAGVVGGVVLVVDQRLHGKAIADAETELAEARRVGANVLGSVIAWSRRSRG